MLAPIHISSAVEKTLFGVWSRDWSVQIRGTHPHTNSTRCYTALTTLSSPVAVMISSALVSNIIVPSVVVCSTVTYSNQPQL